MKRTQSQFCCVGLARALYSLSRVALKGEENPMENQTMKLFVIAVASAAILGTSAYAQNSRVPEQEAKPGKPTVGQPQTSDPRTTTGQAPIAVPGAGSPYGAKGGPTGNPNPDRVPAGTPGGANSPPN
jgi:hypothetical protein